MDPSNGQHPGALRGQSNRSGRSEPRKVHSSRAVGRELIVRRGAGRRNTWEVPLLEAVGARSARYEDIAMYLRRIDRQGLALLSGHSRIKSDASWGQLRAPVAVPKRGSTR